MQFSNKENYFREIAPFFLVSILFFVLGIFSGFFGTKNSPKEAQQIIELLQQSFSFFFQFPAPLQIFLIFIFNSLKAFLILMSGFFLFFLPLSASFFNGVVLGIFSFYFRDSIFSMILSLLPHGIFELPAIFLSVALGMKINYQILKKIFTKKVPLFFEIKKALFFFFRFVVFLFFIAAGLEILVSKPISEFLLQ